MKIKSSGIFMIYLAQSIIIQSLNLIKQEHNIFQLKLFYTAVTFKYNQGHWQWHEWVKFNEHCHHAKSDIYHFYSVW